MKFIWIAGLIALALVGGLWLAGKQAHHSSALTAAQMPKDVPVLLVAAMADPQTASKPAALTVCPQGPPTCQFSKIQAAIDAATPDSTLLIQSGTYEENLFLNKSLQLIGTGVDPVRIQGKEVGGTTITLQLEPQTPLQPPNELRVLLEGLIIMGLSDSAGISTGLHIGGQGSLLLAIADSQITQVGFGLGCRFSSVESTTQIAVVHSRIASTFAGIAGPCSFQGGGLRLEDVTFTGNNFDSIAVRALFAPQLVSRRSTSVPPSVLIEGSRFVGNGIGIVTWDVTGNLTIRNSWFLYNSYAGVWIEGTVQGSTVEIQASHFVGNETGVGIGNSLSTHQDGKLVIEDSSFIGNRHFGLLAAMGNTEIRNNFFEDNGTGVSVYAATVPLQIEGNRIVSNREWGVALYRVPCVPADATNPIPPKPGLDPPIPAFIQGQGNEIHDNGKGDLCPLDYNWPTGFRKP